MPEGVVLPDPDPGPDPDPDGEAPSVPDPTPVDGALEDVEGTDCPGDDVAGEPPAPGAEPAADVLPPPEAELPGALLLPGRELLLPLPLVLLMDWTCVAPPLVSDNPVPPPGPPAEVPPPLVSDSPVLAPVVAEVPPPLVSESPVAVPVVSAEVPPPLVSDTPVFDCPGVGPALVSATPELLPPGAPPGMGIAAGTWPAHEGTAARAPWAAPEMSEISCLPWRLTSSIASLISCSLPASIAAGRAASSVVMADSTQPTTPAIWASIAPRVVAQASRHAAAWAT